MKHNWEYKPLGDCFSYIKNGANIKQSKDASGFPITRIETLSNGVFNRDRVGFADITDLSIYKNHILQNGDLLMSHINSKTYVGRTVKYSAKPNEVFIHGMNLLRLIPYDWINSQYFYYFTNSYLFKSKIINIRKDAVNQSSFSISDLKKIPTPVPPMEVQEQIVAELDKINELIEQNRELLRQLDSLAQSLFYDTFGDPVTNPKGWPINLVGSIVAPKCEILRANKVYSAEDEIMYVDISAINRKANRIENPNSMLFKDAPSRAQQKINLGDIVVSLVRPNLRNIAINKIAGDYTIASSGFGVLRPISGVSTSSYLYYSINSESITEYLCSKISGAAYPAITEDILRNVPLPFPPLSLQQQFATQIEAIETQKAAIEKSISELQTLLECRMNYWFN